MTNRTVLLSIRPRFAELILSGDKTVELRRSTVRASKGDRVLLYVSSPRSSVVGSFEIRTVTSSKPSRLWSLVKNKCGVSRGEFDEYYAAAKYAVAIFLCNPRAFDRPIPLRELRERLSGFHPPQSFRYLPESMLSSLGLGRA
jgi:predicted transcriptional regulator